MMTTGSKYLGSAQLKWIVPLKRSDFAHTESYKARTGSNFLGNIRVFISIEQIQHSSRMSFLVKKGQRENQSLVLQNDPHKADFLQQWIHFEPLFPFYGRSFFYLKKRQPGIRRNPVFLQPTSDLFGRSRDRR